MVSFSTLCPLALSLAVVAAGTPSLVDAQAVVQPLPGNTDADRLADQMRTIAVNPNDTNALITAGELSLKLDDLSGAASLFARAEKVDPRNARLKAGEASVLVRSERPGEALRYFTQAQAMGLDPAQFARDRGLAYDLVGEQDRAQRDYRLALRAGPDEEVTRRYALSLGIAGKRDLALELLDPLLRDTDRGAWRARAFVLAMAGDLPGAERIATTMMPPGMAEGLQPFFQRLPSLPAVDRAFAVHFGEVRATPERIADARLVPPLPVLAPDPTAPVQVTRVAAAAPVVDKPAKRSKRAKPGRVEIATAPVVAQQAALPPPPAYRGQPIPVYAPPPVAVAASAGPNATARANAQQLASIRADTRAAVPSSSSMTPVVPLRGRGTVAATALAVANTQPAAVTQPSARATAATPTAARAAPVAVSPTPSPGFGSIAPVMPPPAAVAAAAPVERTPETMAPATPVAVASTPVVSTPASTPPSPSTALVAPVVTAASARVFATSEPAASLPATTTAAAPGFALSPAAPASATMPRAGARDSADAILARIVAGLSIPASELGVPAMPSAAAPAPATNVIAEAKAKEARDVAAEQLLAQKAAADQAAAEKLAAAKALADKKKAAADKKALAAKKLADEQKAADAKAAAEEKKAARANPERIWVQVSGGANEGDLPKAWATVKAKAPAVFAGKSGWSTPLRATNRVLAGPFKTDTEARAFVNGLAKAGVSAFTFTSDAGQVVTRLPTK